MMRSLLLFLALVLSTAAMPQPSSSSVPVPSAASSPSWEQLFRDWMTLEDASYGEETFELLAGLADNKLNLNQTTREELEQLPFLSATQIEELIAYRDRYKPMRSLNELLMIQSLDWNTRRLLVCFVCCDPLPPSTSLLPPLSTLFQEGRHTLQATLKIPFYERKGDQNGYAGYRYRHDLRYQFNYRDRLKFGLTAAQDAGEPFFTRGNNWGYDHYSYYFQLRRMGRLEELNLGMFRVQMGMGLVMNTGFYLGKLAMLQSQGRSSHVLTAHASRASYGYLRGAAATWRLADHWRVTAFASYRPLDATLNEDGTARTIVTNGYHRTESELAKKNNMHLTDLGARLAWRATALGGLASLSANVLYSHFDRSLVPYASSSSSALYRRYALSGSSFFHASLDYAFTRHRWSLAGETALNRDGALAAVHSLSCRLSSQWTLMLLHRYYDKRYTAFHAYAFSEGGNTQNEHGIYLGATWTPSRNTLLKAYVDYAHFPWARYQVSLPSDAFDALLYARTLIYNKVTVEGRYRFHLRQRDNDQRTLLQNRYEHRARLRLSLPLSAFTLSTQADAALVDNLTVRSRGLMLSQQLAWQHRWLQLSGMVGWFHTDDYDSRLYLYEPSVRYDFSFPMYDGHGLRYSLMARADLGRFQLTAKMGTTNYFDRAVISTGLQQVSRSSITDLLLQLHYRF